VWVSRLFFAHEQQELVLNAVIKFETGKKIVAQKLMKTKANIIITSRMIRLQDARGSE